jgi:hypothetical protein
MSLFGPRLTKEAVGNNTQKVYWIKVKSPGMWFSKKYWATSHSFHWDFGVLEIRLWNGLLVTIKNQQLLFVVSDVVTPQQ